MLYVKKRQKLIKKKIEFANFNKQFIEKYCKIFIFLIYVTKKRIQLNYSPITNVRNFETIIRKSINILYFSNWKTNPYRNKCFGFCYKNLFLPT